MHLCFCVKVVVTDGVMCPQCDSEDEMSGTVMNCVPCCLILTNVKVRNYLLCLE